MSSLPTYPVPRRVGGEGASGHFLEDTEEGGWMYASLPRAISSTKDKWASSLGLFKEFTKFRRYFVRFTIRNGTSSAMINDSDDPDEPPLVVYDLSTVVNVAKLSLPQAEALQFVTSNGDTEELECIHGQLIVGLQFQEHGMLRLAFPKTTIRDAWAKWFSELVVQRELSEIDAGTNDGSFDVTTPVVHVPTFQSTLEGKQVLGEYTRKFLQSSVKASRADEIPDKGKINVMPTGFTHHVPCTVSANIKNGVLNIVTRRPTLFGPKVPPQLHLVSEDAKIVAALPWGTNFVIYTSDSGAWSFEAKNLEQRNAWVQYCRTVKGRGKVAQTDQQTFPYLNSAEAVARDVDELASSLAKTLKHGLTIQRVESSSSDESEIEEGDSFTPTIGTEAARLLATPAVLTFDRALADFPHLAWTTVEDIESPRSEDSEKPRSIRPFRPFPSHFDHVVLSYVDASCAPHLLGRRNFHLGLHPNSTAYKNAEAQKRDAAATLGKSRLSPDNRARISPYGRIKAATATKSGATAGSLSLRRRSASPSRREPSPLESSRTLKMGLTRLRLAAEDKERLRPKVVGPSPAGRSRTPFGARTTNRNSGLSDVATLSRNDQVKIPKCLFSNVAPHIVLSPHLGPTTRR